MSVNIHVLLSHLNYFPETLGAFGEEQGKVLKRYKIVAKMYQKKWKVSMIAN